MNRHASKYYNSLKNFKRETASETIYNIQDYQKVHIKTVGQFTAQLKQEDKKDELIYIKYHVI